MILSATDVGVRLGDTPVFDGVTLGVSPGEVLTVVGPSGVGKSTLLRLLIAFRRPDDGSVAWEGTDIWQLAAAERLAVRRRISMVFQEPSLFNAPVHQNVSHGLRLRQSWPERLRGGLRRAVGVDSPDPRVTSALETVGLVDRRDQNALSLSGGEAQRVAFARALAVDPAVMLLDEPTSNLDPRNTAVIEAAVERARDRGVGVVVATHDMHQAKRLSDRVAFLFDGELVETGPPEQIFEDPTDPRTKRFVDGELLVAADETPPARVDEVARPRPS